MVCDPQSNMSLYSQYATQMALKDRVAVVHGGITSASRETIRPIFHRSQMLYFYHTLYEGGACDRNEITLGSTPAQTVKKLIPHAMTLPAAFGAALRYVMFYGRLADVCLGVVTMVVTLIFWKLINHTAGPEYSVGDARLGGYNGFPSIPILNVPGDPAAWLDPAQMFQVFMGILIVVYVFLRVIIASDFGRLPVGIRENETCSSLLGYDVRRHKVIVFAIGSGIAGMAGAMWASYQTFIDPNAFSLEMSAKALVWVMAGGVGTLAGPILAVILLQWLSLKLGTLHILNNYVILGAIMMVLLLPKGLLPTVKALTLRLWFFGQSRMTSDATGGKVPSDV